MQRASIAVVVLLLSGTGCANLVSALRTSDRTLLSNAEARYLYLEETYKRRCVPIAKDLDRPKCLGWQAAIAQAGDELSVANKVIHKGAIPAEERSALNRAFRKAKAR